MVGGGERCCASIAREEGNPEAVTGGEARASWRAQGVKRRAVRGRQTWPGCFITPLTLSPLSLKFSAPFKRREGIHIALFFQIG